MSRKLGTDKPALNLSPWQKMIHDTRVENGLSYRALGKAAQIPYSKLCYWIHHKQGHPDKASYGLTVNQRLSRALGIDPHDLMRAYDESAVMFTRPRAPMAAKTLDTVTESVSRSRKTKWSKKEVLALLESLRSFD